jgi:hypothetical protein
MRMIELSKGEAYPDSRITNPRCSCLPSETLLVNGGEYIATSWLRFNVEGKHFKAG